MKHVETTFSLYQSSGQNRNTPDRMLRNVETKIY